MEWIQILMSTYNGAAYLPEQLDSILKQTYPYVKLLIRDDGSTDETVAILQDYADKYQNIVFYQGENVGVIQSFLDLLRCSDDSVSYYGFADQDDKWLPEKIECAINVLKVRENPSRMDIPLLYCSDTFIADKELNILKKETKKARPSFGNALVQNICTGCTAVINRHLRDILKETYPKDIVMHDWWLYITATLYGEVCYDTNAHILYRQHGKNAFGARKSVVDIWKYRFEQLGQKRGYIYPQIYEICKWYPDMNDTNRKLVDIVLKSKDVFRYRLQLAFNPQIYRNKIIDDFVFRGIVLIGKL